MGRASISIAITSNFNPSGVNAAIAAAERLAVMSTSLRGKYGKNLVDAGASLGKASSQLVNFGKSVADVGDSLTTHVTVPMLAVGGAAIAAATEIDTAWYGVRKTVDMTEEGYERLKKGAMDLADTQPVSAATILDIEMLGGQLGIANENLESFAKTVSGLDIATNLDAETAATQIAQFANITRMSQDDIDNFGSALVDLGNHSATTESDIMNLALRFASAGHVAGMSNQEILGISASLSSLGMKADAGGSALSQVINKISTEVDTNGEHLQAWAELAGMSVEQFSRAWKEDAAGTFEDVLQGIAASGDKMNAVLEDVDVKQIRTSDAMRRLASSGDLMSQSIERANRAWEENTALQREVDNRNESIQARWDTLKNKITNDLATLGKPLAELGLNALEGLEPAIAGFGRLAETFAQASPDTQRFAFNLAGVAAAAGPVLSVAGRLMQGVGNVGIKVARAQQQFGVFTEALRTNDEAMLLNLADTDTFASRMGLAHNKTVKAAGGVEKFKAQVTAANEVIRHNAEAAKLGEQYNKAYNEAVQKGGASHEEATRAAGEAVKTEKALKQQRSAGNKAVREATNETRAAARETAAYTQELDKQVAAAGKSSTALTNVKSVLLGIGGIAAGAAIGAGITYLVTQLELAAERSNNLKLATEGLKASLGATNETVDEQSRVWGSSIAAVDSAIESQAQLGEQFEQTNTQAQLQTAELDRAWEAISRYANHAGLSASEQYALKSAIDAVNEACGTQYSVVDAANGKIADENGTIQENTDAIYDNIAARRRQIELQAVESNYQAAYENELNAKKALKEVQDEYNDALERYNSYVDPKTHKLRNDLNKEEREDLRSILEQLGPLRDAYEREAEAVESASETTAWYKGELDQLAGAGTAAAGSMEQLLSANSNFTTAFSGEGTKSLGEFAAACETLGINFDSLNTLGPTVANNIADSFDGSARSLVESLGEAGEQGQTILQNIGQNWYNGFSEATQGIIGSVAATRRMSLAELEAMSVDFGVKGEAATRMFMEGLDRGMNEEAAANFAKAITQRFGEDLDPAQFTALAERISTAFKSGLSPEQAQAVASAYSGALASGLQEGEAISRAEEAARRIGEVVKSGMTPEAATAASAAYSSALAAGLTVDEAVSKVSSAIDQINQATSGISPEVAAQAMQAFSSALASGASVDEALSKVQAAIDLINQSPSQLSPEAASTAMRIFTSALADGASPDEALARVREVIDLINQSPNEISPEAAEAAMHAYMDALTDGLEDTDPLQAAIDAIKQLVGDVDLTPAGSQAGSAWSFALQQGITGGFAGVNDVVTSEGLRVGTAGSLSFADGWSAGQPTIDGAVRGTTSGIGTTLSDSWQPANAAGLGAADSFASGFGSGGLGVDTSAAALVLGAITQLQSGVPQAGTAGSDTSTSYASTIGAMQAVAVAAAFATQLAVIESYKLGIAAAQLAGQLTGQAYAQSITTGATGAVSSVTSAVQTIAAAFAGGVAVASAAGSATGFGYSSNLASSMHAAAPAAQAVVTAVASAANAGVAPATAAGLATGLGYSQSLAQQAKLAVPAATAVVASVVATLAAGVAPATAAGRSMGTGFATAFRSSAQRAVSDASSVSHSAAAALASGSSYAYSSGLALGNNFAAGVRAGGAAAVAAARDIAAQVAAVLRHSTPKEGPLRDDDVWGLHMARNFAAGMERGAASVAASARRLAAAASVSATATYRVAGYEAPRRAAPVRAARAANVAHVALARASESNARASYQAGATQAARAVAHAMRGTTAPSQPADYDTLHRVIKSALKQAIKETGGLAPVVELDGKAVSRQIAPAIDYELGRLDRMRG